MGSVTALLILFSIAFAPAMTSKTAYGDVAKVAPNAISQPIEAHESACTKNVEQQEHA